jgi:dienelactone hydrolase
MAGNMKEWTANASGEKRYILGGAWDEPPYQFLSPDARGPFTRNDTFGFRCVRRITPPPRESFAEVTLRPLKPSIQPISDEAIRVFLDLHAYDKSALDSRVERVDDSSPYWRSETVSFTAAYGNERVIAHLFLPRNSQPPYQVVALVGGSTITDVLKRVEDFDYPYQFILRSGRAVMIPALFGTLERGPSAFRLPANQERERGLKWSMDLGRSIDYLETRSDIDANKLGFYGISFGATHGVRLVAVDARLKAAVLLSGGLMVQPVEIDALNFAPRIHVPVLMLNGRDDFIFPLETTQTPLFRALGTKEPDKKHILYEGGHRNPVTRPDMIGEILNWFDRYLGPVKPAQ